MGQNDYAVSGFSRVNGDRRGMGPGAGRVVCRLAVGCVGADLDGFVYVFGVACQLLIRFLGFLSNDRFRISVAPFQPFGKIDGHDRRHPDFEPNRPGQFFRGRSVNVAGLPSIAPIGWGQARATQARPEAAGECFGA